MQNKKAITPYISISLLLIISTFSVVIIYNWLLDKSEDQKFQFLAEDIDRVLEVKQVKNGLVYIENSHDGVNSKGDVNTTLLSISVGGTQCSIPSTKLDVGITTVNISSCLENYTSTDSYSLLLNTVTVT